MRKKSIPRDCGKKESPGNCRKKNPPKAAEKESASGYEKKESPENCENKESARIKAQNDEVATIAIYVICTIQVIAKSNLKEQLSYFFFNFYDGYQNPVC